MIRTWEPHFACAHPLPAEGPPRLAQIGSALFVVFTSQTRALLSLTGVSLSLFNCTKIYKCYPSLKFKGISKLVCGKNTGTDFQVQYRVK